MKNKLVIIALGKPNSGKSNTWYEIFGKNIRSGWKSLKISESELEVFVKNSSFEETNKNISLEIFVKNSSFEECKSSITNYKSISSEFPQIVFCSVQYIEKGIDTINWFKDNGYYLYIQWLNPGFTHKKEYNDFLKIEDRFKEFGEFHRVSAKEKSVRSSQIKKFLVEWYLNNSN